MASVLNSHNLTIVRCIQFKKCLCFKLKYVHFVYSYIVYVAFPSCLCCDDQFVVFTLCYFSSSQGAWGHATVMVNDPFSDLPFFGSEESIWSEITNPFLDSPTKAQPYLLCTFWKRGYGERIHVALSWPICLALPVVVLLLAQNIKWMN